MLGMRSNTILQDSGNSYEPFQHATAVAEAQRSRAGDASSDHYQHAAEETADEQYEQSLLYKQYEQSLLYKRTRALGAPNMVTSSMSSRPAQQRRRRRSSRPSAELKPQSPGAATTQSPAAATTRSPGAATQGQQIKLPLPPSKRGG